ncbi:hypothetical protein TNCV_3332531 [Trichonephila clavipes]|nr:hypothetical protein TNCV_3332531 [Trichonephila clavipes]
MFDLSHQFTHQATRLRTRMTFDMEPKSNSTQWRNSPRRPRSTVPILVFVNLSAEVHAQMFQSGGQSDAKPLLFSSQASLVLILSIHWREERLSQPCPARFEPRNCGVEARYTTTRLLI